MSTYNGYMGKIGLIDLTARTMSEYLWEAPETLLGGKILNQRMMLELLTGTETAFCGENPIILSTGPLTGTGAPGSNRFDIASLSPRDDLPAFSNCGGSFGLYLKKAGYDALILTGRCRKKSWLEISGDTITFHDAADLWGSRTSLCRDRIALALGNRNASILCIGPAGENLVTYASVIADGHSTGRAGIGAVLGWKNLKAIAVTGRKEIPLLHPEEAAARNRAWHASLKRHAQTAEASGAKAFCTGCPLRCIRHGRENDSLLNELGMDSIAVSSAVQWAAEQGIAAPNIHEDIAYRRGIGSQLAEHVPIRKGKGGSRRGGSHQAIAAAFRLPPDAPETKRFCKNLTEAISACGQCMFTVHALASDPKLYVLEQLALITGMEMDLEQLLEIGGRSQMLEQQLLEKFRK